MRAPALYALIFFASGILLAANTDLPSLVYLAVAVLTTSLALIYFLLHRPVVSRILICLALVSAAGFLTELQSSEFPSNHVSRFTSFDAPMTVTGVVASEPDIRPTKTFLAVEVDSLQHHDRTIASCGRLRLQIQEPTSAFNYRDRITFSGYVNRPQSGRNPGAFDYRRYLAIRRISAVVTLRSADQVTLVQSGATEPFIRAVIKPIRDYISSVYERFLPAEQAAVMKGFLIGDVRYIPREVYQRFKDTGTLHVLAASGANVGYVIVTLLVVIKLFRLPRQYKLILLIVGVLIFSFLAYNQPSVVRASVMAIVALIGAALYRDLNWLNNISFAGLVILAFGPLHIYDLGWQLSFAAAYALILFMPSFERLLPRQTGILAKTIRYFLLILYGSIVAQLGVTPILIYNFHYIPLVSFIANLLVVPLVGIATTLGIVLVFVSAIPLASTSVAFLLATTLKVTLSAIDYFHTMPIPHLRMAAPQMLLIIIYYVSLQLIFSLVAKRKAVGLLVVILLLCLNTAIWKEVIAGSQKNLEVTFLDTYKISTTFIEQEDGQAVLINGGGMNQSFNQTEGTVLPFLQAKAVDHLDRIIATTDAEGNVLSLASIITSLEDRLKLTSIDSVDRVFGMERVERSDPVLFFSNSGISIALLTRLVPVQNLNRLPSRINIAGIDWSYLDSGEIAKLLESLHVETLVITNYPNRYAPLKLIAQLRKQYPETQIYSVLESGGIVVNIGNNGYKVLATANN